MQCTEHQVTGFCGGHGHLNRLQVTQLTHQNHFRILPESPPERLGKAGHIHVNFTLSGHCFFVRVIKFNRIFNRNEVTVILLPVDDINH